MWCVRVTCSLWKTCSSQQLSPARYPWAILIAHVIGRASKHTRPDRRFRIGDYPAPPCQSEADLPDRLWQSGKEMDGIRININPVNCLSCTLRVFYLPHLNILPKVSLTLPWYKSPKKFSFSQLKSGPLGRWGNIDASFPFRCLQARNPHWIRL